MVIDDSALMRIMIKDMLVSDPSIEVIDMAKNGNEAIDKLRKLKPDVITLDIEMPVKNGLEVLKVATKEKLSKAIMLSGLQTPDLAYQALRYGAVDFIRKPSGTYSPDIDEIKEELIEKIKAATSANITSFPSTSKKSTRINDRKIKSKINKVVVIGASSGGPIAIETILASLSKELPAGILITQHLPVGFVKSFAERLNSGSDLEVRLGKDGETISHGVVFISPSDCHMTVADKNGKRVIKLVECRTKCIKPSADKLMESVAEVYGNNAIGVILSGMGSDGAKGMEALKKQGSTTLVQDEKSSAIFSMPKSVIDAGYADKVLPLKKIATEIEKELNVK